MISKKSLIIIIFIGFFLIVGYFALKSQVLIDTLVNNFFTKYEEIDVKLLFIGEADGPGGEGAFSSPISERHAGVRVSGDKEAEINLTFRQPISFDSFSLFFKGNLHSVSSYLAEDFDVYYKDKSDRWRKIDQVRGNRSSVYRFYSPVTLSTDSIKIRISKAPFFDIVTYGDLKFYKGYRVGFLEGIEKFFFEQRKSLPAYLFYSFLFYILLLIPGYVTLDLIGRRRNNFIDAEYKIVFAPVITIVLLFLIALIYLLIGKLSILNFYWIIFVFSLFIFLNRRLYKEISSSKFLLFLIGTILLITFLIQAQRDYLFNLQYIEKYLDELEFIPLRGGYYGYHADNTRPWGIARLLLDRKPIFGTHTEDYLMGCAPKEVLDRTPLLPMVAMVILHIFGKSHFIYQRFLNVLAALYYGGAYILLRTYFSRRVAKIGSILILLNVPLTFLAFNAEVYYKYFAIFPMLLAFILFFKEKNEKSLLIGALIGIGFLIHPITLFFSAVLFILYFLKCRFTHQFFKKATAAFSILIILFVCWSLISYYLKAEASISEKNVYLGQITTINYETVKNKLENLLNIFIPNILLKQPDGGSIRLMSQDFWIPVARFSIISNLTPAIFILFLIYFGKNIRNNLEILLMAITPLLIYIILYPDYTFKHHYLLYPFVIPCFLGCVTSGLIEEKRLIRLVVFGSYPLFMFIGLYFFSGVFVTMQYTSFVIHGLFWGIILLYTFLSLLLIKIGACDSNRFTKNISFNTYS